MSFDDSPLLPVDEHPPPEQSQALAAAPVDSAGVVLTALLQDADKLKSFPIETVERMMKLHQELQANEAKKSFYAAFNRVQRRITPVAKKAWNAHTKSWYAKLDHVVAMLDPLMIEEGFSRSLHTLESNQPGMFRFTLTLSHVDGHEKEYYLDAPSDDKGPKGGDVKTKIQGIASAYTYCERHLLCKVWGIQTTEDNDGNRQADTKTITEQQAHDLDMLIGEVKASRPKFLDWLQIKALTELPVARFQEALQALEQKRRQP